MTNSRTKIFHVVEAEIQRRKNPDRPFVLGVTGTDCSGKTVFCESLNDFLQNGGATTQLVRLDDFHQPAAVRHADGNRDEDHWARVREGREFDFDRLIREVLKPARKQGTFTARIPTIDWRSDETGSRELTVNPETVIILEGVFLLLDTVRPYLDYIVYLDVDDEECLRRARLRDPEATWQRYETRYLPAARAHREAYPPGRFAGLVIDNADWRQPRLK